MNVWVWNPYYWLLNVWPWIWTSFVISCMLWIFRITSDNNAFWVPSTTFTFWCFLLVPTSQWLNSIWMTVHTLNHWRNSPPSPVPVLKIYYLITKTDRNHESFANCCLTRKVYVCYSLSEHENPQWSWSCQGSSPVLPPYRSTFLLSYFGLLWVPLLKGCNIFHMFSKHRLSRSHTGKNARVLYWWGNGARKLVNHPLITSWVVSASTWL
jgi:hypothetical protein